MTAASTSCSSNSFRDNDDAYTNGVDSFLGTGAYTGPIAAGAQAAVEIPVSGIVEFDGNLVHALIDPSNVVPELSEANNGSNSGINSRYVPPLDSFDASVECTWRPTANHMFARSIPAVAPLIDTDGDGDVDERDTPAIVTATQGNFFGTGNGGTIYAIRGDTCEEIWHAANPGCSKPSGWHLQLAILTVTGNRRSLELAIPLCVRSMA